MKNLGIVALVILVLLLAVAGVRNFDAGNAPQDEILAYQVSPAQPVEVTLHGGVEQISVTSWLLVPIDTPVDEPLPYALEFQLSDSRGKVRMNRRYENFTRLPPTFTGSTGDEARVADALGYVTEPRTIDVDVQKLEARAGRLRVWSAAGKYDQVLLRLAHRVERSAFEKRLLARTMSTAERDQLTRERSSLGFFDIPDGVRAEALGHWHQRLTAAGREGRDYIVRRLLIGPAGSARPTPEWVGEGYETSERQRLAINVAGTLTLRVRASRTTHVHLDVVGRAAPSVHAVAAERWVDLVVESEGLATVVLFADPPSQLSLSAPLAEAPRIFTNEPPEQVGQRIKIGPDLNIQGLYRLDPDAPLVIGVAPGQLRTGLSVRSTQTARAQETDQVRVVWQDAAQTELSSVLLRLSFEPSLFERVDDQPVTEKQIAQLHVPPGAQRLLVFGADHLLLSPFVEEPGVEQVSYLPPFDQPPPEGLSWVHAPMNVKDWALIRPDNEAALRLANRTAKLHAQIRLEPNVIEDAVLLPRTLEPTREALSRPVFTPTTYSPRYPFPDNAWVMLSGDRPERVVTVAEPGEVSTLYLADTDRLGQQFAVLAGMEPVHQGTLAFRSGAHRLELTPGVVELGTRGLGSGGLLLVQAPPATAGVILKRQTFYALERGRRLDFGFTRGEAELLTVVVMVVTEGGGARVALEHAIDGGSQRGRLDHFYHRMSEYGGRHEVRTGELGEALIWSEPFGAPGAEALPDRLGRAIIRLGDDLGAGAHRLTVRHPGGPEQRGRNRYWVRAVVVGRVLGNN